MQVEALNEILEHYFVQQEPVEWIVGFPAPGATMVDDIEVMHVEEGADGWHEGVCAVTLELDANQNCGHHQLVAFSEVSFRVRIVDDEIVEGVLEEPEDTTAWELVEDLED